MKIIISKLRTVFSFALAITAIGLLGLLLHVTHFRTQVVSAQQPDYAQVKARAEQEYAAGSYARAYDIYAKVSETGLPAEVRWVDFRLADYAVARASKEATNIRTRQSSRQQ